MDGILDQAGGLLHLLQADVHGAGDVDEHAVSAVDGGFQQGAGDGHLGGLLGLALAGGAAHAHVGQTRILHHGGDVGKVQVDEAGVADQVGDGLHRLAQHIIGDFEGIGEGDLLVGGVFQTLVGDDDQGVHPLAQLLDALFRLHHPAAALEGEGLGDHAHGENAQLAGDLRHHGGSAGAGAAAHTGGDEHHVGALQGLGQLVAAFLGGLLAHLRIGAGPLAVGQLLADLDFIGGAGGVQHLLVRVDGHKVHALGAGAYHAVDHVVAAATDADDLDIDHILGAGFHFKCHDGSSCQYISKDSCMQYNVLFLLYNGFGEPSRGGG